MTDQQSLVSAVFAPPPKPGADHQVHAVRFATSTHMRSENFLNYAWFGSPDAPLVCDFYYWVITGPSGITLFDTGFTPEVAETKGKTPLASLTSGLAALDLIPSDVDRIVYSHLHYDHTGHLDLFDNVPVILQRKEYMFWTSPMGRRTIFAAVAWWPDVDQLARAAADDRIVLIDDDHEVAPGLTTVPLFGHTAGQQGLRVQTPGGSVLLASDAAHYYDELDDDLPFFIVDSLAGMYDSFDRMRDFAATGETVVPGHDERVQTRFDTTSYSDPIFGNQGRLVRLG